MWLNYIINENEILINISRNLCELFNFDTINQSKLETKLTKMIEKIAIKNDIDIDIIAITYTYINNQNTKLIEIKANQTEIDSDDIKLEIQEMDINDCFYTHDECIYEINDELKDIAMKDRLNRLNLTDFFLEHPIIDSILHDDAFSDELALLKKHYFVDQLIPTE